MQCKDKADKDNNGIACREAVASTGYVCIDVKVVEHQYITLQQQSGIYVANCHTQRLADQRECLAKEDVH